MDNAMAALAELEELRVAITSGYVEPTGPVLKEMNDLDRRVRGMFPEYV